MPVLDQIENATGGLPKKTKAHLRLVKGGAKPVDDNEYNRAIEEFIDEFKIKEEIVLFIKQFKMLLDHLGTWIQKNKKAISRAYITTRDSELLFLIVRKKVPLDIAFEDMLSDLELDICRNSSFNKLSLRTMSLPFVDEDSTESFLHPHRIIYTGI